MVAATCNVLTMNVFSKLQFFIDSNMSKYDNEYVLRVPSKTNASEKVDSHLLKVHTNQAYRIPALKKRYAYSKVSIV